MPDSRTDVDGRDRSRVAREQPYALSDFADKHGISVEQALALIERHGNDREAQDRAAERLSSESNLGE